MVNIERVEVFGHFLPEAEETYYKSRQWASKNFNASSFVDCGRMQAYGLLGYASEEKMVVQYKRDADTGDYVHSRLQSWAISSGKMAMLPNFERDMAVRNAARAKGVLQPGIEVPLAEWVLSPEKYQEFKRYRLGGRVDGILQRSNGQRVVWEIKTLAAKYVDNPSALYQRIYQDKLKHFVSQVQLYMHFLEIQEALILVVNRERFLEMMMGRGMSWEDVYIEYGVTYDREYITGQLERLERLNALVLKTELPEPEPELGNCRFCNWRKICPNPGK